MVQQLPKLGARSAFPYAYYKALNDHAATLAATFGETGEDLHLRMTAPGRAEPITLRAVTPGFFDALGVQPLYGRAFHADDENRKFDTPPAVLSYGFWRRRFGGDPAVVRGQTLAVNGHRFLIIGVMPRGFNGLSADTAPDLRIPWQAFPLLVDFKVESASFELAGRLRTGFTRAQAEAECLAIWQSTMKDYYRTVEREPPKAASMLLSRGMKLEPLARGTSILRDRFGDALKLLMGAAALLLSIVCLNVAGLLLARTAARQQEIAVRLAIGATRLRIMRQMIAESLLLVIFGCGAGMCIAMAATPLILRLLPPVRDLGTALVPLSIDTSVGRRVLLCSLLLSIITALICGVGPAIATSRWNLDTVLRGVRASGAMRGRQVLIALQIALFTFMLAETGLLLRTFQQLQDTPPGFARDYVATFTADLAGNQVVRAYLNALTERVRRLPGVASLAISSVGVMRGHGISASVAPAGQVISRADFMNVNVNLVSPEYFQTLGMRILSGRDFTQADAIGPERRGPERAVVNETFAKRFFPNTAPIGKRFGMGIEGTAAVGTYELSD